jgi:tRNA(adenine34) deaminase
MNGHCLCGAVTYVKAFPAPPNGRRTAVLGAVSLLVAGAGARAGAVQPESRWYDAALQMKRLAESWGDQAYGAVLVLDGAVIGEGPSRVVKNGDPNAHAEREAIRDARRRLGRQSFPGAVLYSTSRPCALCEAAAAEAGVRRMYFGAALTDAGTPGHGLR